MIWETCIEYGRDLTFALGAGFRRARHPKSNQSASCMAAKALADVDVHDTDRIQARSGAADAGSDEALHRQELVGRAAKWVAVSDDVQATLPVDLPEKYRQRSPDSCKVAWLCCPSVPELNGIYRHSDLATNCGHCLNAVDSSIGAVPWAMHCAMPEAFCTGRTPGCSDATTPIPLKGGSQTA